MKQDIETKEVREAILSLNTTDLDTVLGELRFTLDEISWNEVRRSFTALALHRGLRPGAAGTSGEVEHSFSRFMERALGCGYAEPFEVDHLLLQARAACESGEYELCKRIVGELLPPLFSGDIDLSQPEHLEEVLAVDLEECVHCYLLSSYMMAKKDRARDFIKAFESICAVQPVPDCLEAMQRLLGRPLPGMQEFLPVWRDYLSAGQFSRRLDRYQKSLLREATQLLSGVSGLRDLALETLDPDWFEYWYWTARKEQGPDVALEICDLAATKLKGSREPSFFLEKAVELARELGHSDLENRLFLRYENEPDLESLLLWLSHIRERSRGPGPLKKAIAQSMKRKGTDALQATGLALCQGNLSSIGRWIEKASALGWSFGDHPGHLGIMGLMTALVNASWSRSAGKWKIKYDTLRPEFLWDHSNLSEEMLARLVDLIAETKPQAELNESSVKALLNAIRITVEKRAEGILSNKRRNHYAHIAFLMCCYVRMAEHLNEDRAMIWFISMENKYSHFSRFKKELNRQLKSNGWA